jgi:hypothetical protein
MTTTKGDDKFLIRNVKDVIYKDLIIKGNPALQIELAKNNSGLYQCFAADGSGNRCPQTFRNYSGFRKHFNNDHGNPPYFYKTFKIHKMCRYSLSSHEDKKTMQTGTSLRKDPVAEFESTDEDQEREVQFTKIKHAELKRKKDHERQELMQLRRSENIKTGNFLDENLRALEIFDGEYSSFGEMSREELYQKIFKQLLKRKSSYIRRHPSMLTKPYNQQFIDNKIQIHIMLMELLVRNFRLNYKQGQHVYCQKLNEINEDFFYLFGKVKPIHLYDVNEMKDTFYHDDYQI